jgi:hypothetical protein
LRRVGGLCARDGRWLGLAWLDLCWLDLTWVGGWMEMTEAYVLKAAGVCHWAMERVAPGTHRNISNGLSIRTQVHLPSISSHLARSHLIPSHLPRTLSDPQVRPSYPISSSVMLISSHALIHIWHVPHLLSSHHVSLSQVAACSASIQALCRTNGWWDGTSSFDWKARTPLSGHPLQRQPLTSPSSPTPLPLLSHSHHGIPPLTSLSSPTPLPLPSRDPSSRCVVSPFNWQACVGFAGRAAARHLEVT